MLNRKELNVDQNLMSKGKQERVISLLVLVGMLITVWYMLDLVLLTFLLTFIFYHLLNLVQGKQSRTWGKKLPDNFVLSVLYIVFIVLLSFLSIEVFPKLIDQINIIANALATFDIEAVKRVVGQRMALFLSGIDINSYLGQAGTLLAGLITKVSGFLFNFFIGLILSFLILAEKNKIYEFGQNVKKSNVSFIYDSIVTYGGGFCKTFGKVMKVQVTIAFINSLLSMIILAFLGFPAIGGLGLMIFGLGLIPVAGVVVSFIPLSVIGFSIGGVRTVVEVVLLIVAIHTVEAYILNPKLMSQKTRLPVSFVFIILVVAEHYLGVWGLLIGVPIFIFLMTAFAIDYKVMGKNKII